MAFPTNPTDGQRETLANGITYVYHSTDNKWRAVNAELKFEDGLKSTTSGDTETVVVDTDVIADTEWVNTNYVKKDGSNLESNESLGVFKVEPETAGDPVIGDFTGNTKLILQY